MPAGKWLIVPSAATITTSLFSCSVTAMSPASLTETNSGSGSSGAMAARPVRSIRSRAAQSAPASVSGSFTRNPAGICGRAPSFTSSSRSFSMAMARNEPSGALATESGWPPRSQEATSLRLSRSTVTSLPEGAV